MRWCHRKGERDVTRLRQAERRAAVESCWRESFLGPARLYSELTIGADLARTASATGFLTELMQVSRCPAPDAAERLASMGVGRRRPHRGGSRDRMAQEVPRSMHGNATVQRAKAHVAADLGEPGLDPPPPAAAVGMLAYDCGLTDQAHFARRFKDRFDRNPRDDRRAQDGRATGRVRFPAVVLVS